MVTTHPNWLSQQAIARADHPAILTEEGTVSFARLERRVASLARRLDPPRSGSRVGILLENGLGLAESVLACLRIGRSAVLFDARLGVEEVRPLVEAARPGVLLANGPTAEVGRAIAREADLELVDPAGHGEVASGRGVAPIDLDREAVVVFSSGTSGMPKPVSLSAGNLLWSAVGSAARLGTRPDDRWLACLPLSHLGGLSILFRGVIFGSTMVLHPGFDLPRVRAALEEDHVSIVSLVPTTLARLVESGPLRASALRGALIGGAGASLDLLEAARAHGIPAAPTYGLTETASQVATLGFDAPLVETGHVGAPLLPTEIAIVGAEAAPVAAGEVGRILVRGATVSRRAADAAGWLHTGDLGRRDAHGALTVLGRHDDVIVTGGENISPGEVEEVLGRLPGVREVAVAAVADPQWGHVVGAWVVPAEALAPTLEGLRRGGRERLAPHKLPRHLTLVDALPRTALGKVRRRELRRP